MPTALIVGASRGIGLELVRQYRLEGWRVIATARNELACDALRALGAETHLLDICNLEQCAGMAWKLDDERLDIAVLNAGVYGPKSIGMQTPLQTEFEQVMQTNVLAAMRLLPILAPLVGSAGGRLAVVSSMMGSLSLRAGNSGWLYRASKAALNSVLLDCAHEYPQHKAICVALHPGWVRTDMGGSNADLAVTESVAGIRHTLGHLHADDNGKFFNYDGNLLSW